MLNYFNHINQIFMFLFIRNIFLKKKFLEVL